MTKPEPIRWVIYGEGQCWGTCCVHCGYVFKNGDVVANQTFRTTGGSSGTVGMVKSNVVYAANHKKCFEEALGYAPNDNYDTIKADYEEKGLALWSN